MHAISFRLLLVRAIEIARHKKVINAADLGDGIANARRNA
jgi:hypothetical protein